jgi:uncharacterized protein YndB with AHSA1/START domain
MSDLVTRSVLIPAAPEEVWDALIEPSRLAEWFADEIEAAELIPDAEVVFRWDDGRERHGVVEEVDEPERLVFRWSAADGDESQVAFDLVEEAAGTRVTVVETGLTRRSVGGRGAPGAGSWGPRLRALALCACAVAA